MRSTIPLSLALSIATTASAQDLLYYKFNEGCGDKVINYAAASPAPAEGTLISTLPSGPGGAWLPGAQGNALAGATFGSGQFTYVDTGWNPGTITGSMSYAFWMRVHGTQSPPSLSYLFGVPVSFGFRLFGGGGSLFTASWQGGSGSPTLTSRTNVWALASLGWVHVALVIDATLLTATYYINGVAELPFTITGGANWSAPQFFVGRQINTTNFTVFDLDEFLLVNSALSAAQVAALASAPLGADGRYGLGGCGGLRLSSAGGLPRLGNFGYGLVVDSANPFAFVLGLGASRCSFGPVPLPFDLGNVAPYLAGCMLEAPLGPLTLTGASPGGPAGVSLPIPQDPSLTSATLYAQSIAADFVTTRLIASNAFALSLGQ